MPPKDRPLSTADNGTPIDELCDFVAQLSVQLTAQLTAQFTEHFDALYANWSLLSALNYTPTTSKNDLNLVQTFWQCSNVYQAHQRR